MSEVVELFAIQSFPRCNSKGVGLLTFLVCFGVDLWLLHQRSLIVSMFE